VRIALTRDVSPNIDRCELTHVARETIDIDIARSQHERYQKCLSELGCTVHRLPADPDLPDSVFVEDTAIVLPELAIITRPGAESRRPETETIAEALEPYRELVHIEEPACLDGGDGLLIDRTLYVGLTGRTNRAAVDQLTSILSPHGYAVEPVLVFGCLHLKSAATSIARETLLINRRWVEPAVFGPLRTIEVDDSEPYGANALRISECVVYPSSFPKTRQRLEEAGIPVRTVDISELSKAEGAVTCCSLIVDT
jgi:dimethylargininase